MRLFVTQIQAAQILILSSEKNCINKKRPIEISVDKSQTGGFQGKRNQTTRKTFWKMTSRLFPPSKTMIRVYKQMRRYLKTTEELDDWRSRP